MLEIIKQTKKFLDHNNKLFGVIAIAIVVPLTVALVFIRQDFRQRAGGGPIITSLAFNPAIINAMPNAHKSIPMSVLAYDQQGQPIGDGVSYSWGISSTSVTSIGTLSYINNNIATFTPLNDGHGDIYVTATNFNGSYTGSMPVNVGNVTITNTPTPTLCPTCSEILLSLTPTATRTPTPTGQLGKPGDTNGDNLVNLTDLSVLLSHWQLSFTLADFNSDGIVNLTDLSILLTNWSR